MVRMSGQPLTVDGQDHHRLKTVDACSYRCRHDGGILVSQRLVTFGAGVDPSASSSEVIPVRDAQQSAGPGQLGLSRNPGPGQVTVAGAEQSSLSAGTHAQRNLAALLSQCDGRSRGRKHLIVGVCMNHQHTIGRGTGIDAGRDHDEQCDPIPCLRCQRHIRRVILASGWPSCSAGPTTRQPGSPKAFSTGFQFALAIGCARRDRSWPVVWSTPPGTLLAAVPAVEHEQDNRDDHQYRGDDREGDLHGAVRPLPSDLSGPTVHQNLETAPRIEVYRDPDR